jgi:DNA-binding transcriptional MerR regulator
MYRIGELAALASCQAATVRYYEKEGLMGRPSRRENGYRLYDREDAERLVFIRHCREHGLRLEEIAELLALKDQPGQNCRRVDEIVERQIKKLDESLSSLLVLKGQLTDLRNKCPGLGSVAECGIMRGLSDKRDCPCFDSPGQPDPESRQAPKAAKAPWPPSQP